MFFSFFQKTDNTISPFSDDRIIPDLSLRPIVIKDENIDRLIDEYRRTTDIVNEKTGILMFFIGYGFFILSVDVYRISKKLREIEKITC